MDLFTIVQTFTAMIVVALFLSSVILGLIGAAILSEKIKLGLASVLIPVLCFLFYISIISPIAVKVIYVIIKWRP